MQIREEVNGEKVAGYICDICSDSCNREDHSDYESHEWAELKATWGYWSNKDLEIHECHMCENCYDLVRQFIESIGGKVRRWGYGPPNMPQPQEGVDYIIRKKEKDARDKSKAEDK